MKNVCQARKSSPLLLLLSNKAPLTDLICGKDAALRQVKRRTLLLQSLSPLCFPLAPNAFDQD